MKSLMNAGWSATKQQVFVISLLFVYELVWGVLLYKFVMSILVPLLHRLPNEAPSPGSMNYFIAESQFHLLKTNIAFPYLWILLAFCLVKMLLTPPINAGLYYSLSHEGSKLRNFFKGIKLKTVAFLWLYGLHMILLISPLYWLIPWMARVYSNAHSYSSVLWPILLVALLYILYGGLLHLLFMYLQFSRVSQQTLLKSLTVLLRSILPALKISFTIFLLAAFLAILMWSISLLWAGAIALILHQVYQLMKIIIKVLEISTQQHLWESKNTLQL